MTDSDPILEGKGDGQQQEGRRGSVKTPGQWNWEGVWEKRVHGGIDTSLSDPVLFGSARGGSEDLVRWIVQELYMSHADILQIRFVPMDEEALQGVKTKMLGL